MSETFNNGSKDGIDVNYHQYNVNMAFHNQSMMSPQNNVNMDYSINQQQQVQYPATLQAGASDVLKVCLKKRRMHLYLSHELLDICAK